MARHIAGHEPVTFAGRLMAEVRGLFSKALPQLSHHVGFETVDETRDVLHDIERVVVSERGQVHRKGERVALIDAVAFEKRCIRYAPPEDGEVIAFSPGDLAVEDAIERRGEV